MIQYDIISDQISLAVRHDTDLITPVCVLRLVLPFINLLTYQHSCHNLRGLSYVTFDNNCLNHEIT